MKRVKTGNISFSNSDPLVFVGGICVIESEKQALETAMALKRKIKAPFVFKASFDKANRTSVSSYRGPGIKKGLEILAQIKRRIMVPVMVDVHEPWQAEKAAAIADILQIPAFLCRQTDLVTACARTGRVLNIKKGQFLPPGNMINIIEKAVSAGNDKILLTERGTVFGHADLVVDMRSVEIMKKTGYPVIFDCTHSVQKPGGLGNATGGNSEFAAPLARAATALGIAGVFFETHKNPEKALSDGPNSLKLSIVPRLVNMLKNIDKAVKGKAR